jgi:hypothetical protein
MSWFNRLVQGKPGLEKAVEQAARTGNNEIELQVNTLDVCSPFAVGLPLSERTRLFGQRLEVRGHMGNKDYPLYRGHSRYQRRSDYAKHYVLERTALRVAGAGLIPKYRGELLLVTED